MRNVYSDVRVVQIRRESIYSRYGRRTPEPGSRVTATVAATINPNPNPESVLSQVYTISGLRMSSLD